MERHEFRYPFTAIVGQEKMKKTLVLNAINPRLGGVLIRGEKGTAKSTAVRSLANLLPEIEVVKGCLWGCDPDENNFCTDCRASLDAGKKLTKTKKRARVVDLPIGATEDRVVGTLDIESAIKKGEKHFEQGILAEAHRGMLYVDEVNLLDDHIVDLLLDSAAMGVNIVEREGISFSHPANFILIGTMNPEEGELRPQILDRFGLCVQVEGLTGLDQRVVVVSRRAEYEHDPRAFVEKWEKEEKKLEHVIVKAKRLLSRVTIAEDMLYLIARIAIEMGVDGHRSDIVMMKTSKTIAAFHRRTKVQIDDVREAAEIVLPHRMRRKPFQKTGIEKEKLEKVFTE